MISRSGERRSGRDADRSGDRRRRGPWPPRHRDRVGGLGARRRIGAELFEDEDLFERGWLSRFEGDPLIGGIEIFGPGIEFSATRGHVRRPIPMLWQHTREVHAELGYDEEGIARLVEARAVVTLENA